MKNVLRHLSSFIAPIVMCLVLPYVIVVLERHSLRPAPLVGLVVAGSLITLVGVAVLVATIRMFILIGNGTIMPWDPTRKLIVAGLYGHVRNPMILGVIIVEVGEAFLFASYGLAILAILNFILNTTYFIYSEEPGLKERFGKEYVEYKKNVPRWIPRLKAWRPRRTKIRQAFQVQVRKPIEFLTALLEHIQGDALMSMEGDLSRCSFEEFEGIRDEPIGQRKKHPILDVPERSNYIVFPLSEANRSRLVHDVLHRIGLKMRVYHIEIEQNGRQIFGAYDQFYPDSTWVDRCIGEETLIKMQEGQLIRGFTRVQWEDQ